MGGVSLFLGQRYPKDRDDPPLSGFLLHPVSPLHDWAGAWVSGGRGEAGLTGALGPPVPLEESDSPPWSLLLC